MSGTRCRYSRVRIVGFSPADKKEESHKNRNMHFGIAIRLRPANRKRFCTETIVSEASEITEGRGDKDSRAIKRREAPCETREMDHK